MVEIRKTDIFARWLDGMRDLQARARVQARIEKRLALWDIRAMSNPWARVFSGIANPPTGPGYRVYYKQRGRELVILLAGGDKSTQAKDISIALRLARNL